MPAVVKCVVYKSKANVTADYENIKYYFRAPQDQDPTGTSHWDICKPYVVSQCSSLSVVRNRVGDKWEFVKIPDDTKWKFVMEDDEEADPNDL